ncbi:dihydrofolate reductase family protein [Actinotalea ferrariae]|uniref:dihydrofolate reductase family protein n=1 Tax=Actinotalea ferrariae TaxID=1386098 RepID=UPI001C8C3FCF|nr:dihydrofolate reductase family protein [Actinotalea ferrariae]MBX9244904.1 dihydrofolate reductase family protein [Actinotalea ferrariae]
MKLVVTQFVTLDGVNQGPGSAAEDATGGFTRGGWLVPHMDDAFVARASDWLDLADGLLLGRRTYQAFARDWPAITDPDDPFTARMNSLPKYVASTTLTSGDWSPTTVLTGDPLRAVAALKAQPGRELQVHGSGRLAASLLAAGLVDVLRLAVAPTVVGGGRRLLDHPGSAVGLRLVAHEVTPAGVLLLEYATAGGPPLADYDGVAALARTAASPSPTP